MHLDDGTVLRFHDARCFGRLRVSKGLPSVGPELLHTPHGLSWAPVVTLPYFARWILGEGRPVKVALMDQDMLAGIGNIYASEACHVAGIDPATVGRDLDPGLVPVLLEALRYVVDLRIPTIDYSNLLVYRRETCGTCSGPITRTEIAKRSTFTCKECQS
jgi:formamidopyrimidine-DNA glycosylase